jgi:hypothetical protein
VCDKQGCFKKLFVMGWQLCVNLALALARVPLRISSGAAKMQLSSRVCRIVARSSLAWPPVHSADFLSVQQSLENQFLAFAYAAWHRVAHVRGGASCGKLKEDKKPGVFRKQSFV